MLCSLVDSGEEADGVHATSIFPQPATPLPLGCTGKSSFIVRQKSCQVPPKCGADDAATDANSPAKKAARASASPAASARQPQASATCCTGARRGLEAQGCIGASPSRSTAETEASSIGSPGAEAGGTGQRGRKSLPERFETCGDGEGPRISAKSRKSPAAEDAACKVSSVCICSTPSFWRAQVHTGCSLDLRWLVGRAQACSISPPRNCGHFSLLVRVSGEDYEAFICVYQLCIPAVRRAFGL